MCGAGRKPQVGGPDLHGGAPVGGRRIALRASPDQHLQSDTSGTQVLTKQDSHGPSTYGRLSGGELLDVGGTCRVGHGS